MPDALVADCSTQACFIGRSKAKLGLGNPGAALKDAQAFINHQPNNEAGYSCKGMALEAQHRYTDAEAALVAGSCLSLPRANRLYDLLVRVCMCVSTFVSLRVCLYVCVSTRVWVYCTRVCALVFVWVHTLKQAWKRYH